jgi:hypothetical protein
MVHTTQDGCHGAKSRVTGSAQAHYFPPDPILLVGEFEPNKGDLVELWLGGTPWVKAAVL